MTEFRTFLALLVRDWLAIMSGSATVPLAVAAYVVPGSVQRVLFTVLAILCGLASGYRVWIVEREAGDKARRELSEEREKNAAPQLFCKIEEVYVDHWLTGSNVTRPSQDVIDTYVTVQVRVVNRRPAPISLKGFRLGMETAKGRRELEPSPLDGLAIERSRYKAVPRSVCSEQETVQDGLLDMQSDPTSLTTGALRMGWLRFVLEACHIDEAEILSIELTVVDAFDGEHRVASCRPWVRNGRIVHPG